MGPGMSFQLRENEFVRDIFGLGPKISSTNNSAKTKTSKLERVIGLWEIFHILNFELIFDIFVRSAAFN